MSLVPFSQFISQRSEQQQQDSGKIPFSRSTNFEIPGLKWTGIYSKLFAPQIFHVVLGKPGSGKSMLIGDLLMNQGYYRGKFDKVFFVGPTGYERHSAIKNNLVEWNSPHGKGNYGLINQMKVPSVENIKKMVKFWSQYARYKNVLIVFDDVMGFFLNLAKQWPQFFNNRRHLLGDENGKGGIHILVGSQGLKGDFLPHVRNQINVKTFWDAKFALQQQLIDPAKTNQLISYAQRHGGPNSPFDFFHVGPNGDQYFGKEKQIEQIAKK